jgi:hypothetical protein
VRGLTYEYGKDSGKICREQIIASKECTEKCDAFTLDPTIESKQPGDTLLTVNVPMSYEDGNARGKDYSLDILLFTSIKADAEIPTIQPPVQSSGTLESGEAASMTAVPTGTKSYYWYQKEDVDAIDRLYRALDQTKPEEYMIIKSLDDNYFPANYLLSLQGQRYYVDPETALVAYNRSFQVTFDPETGTIS